MKISEWKEKEKPLNSIINCDCLEGFKELNDNYLNLVITSPPYNCAIKYDTWNDDLPSSEYFDWVKKWLSEIYRTLKDDGRMAINIPYEVNWKFKDSKIDKGGRVFMASEYWMLMKEIGFQWGGIVDLKEVNSHRVKLTAWGSWLKASAPYIYNPKECVIIVYKKTWGRKDKKSTLSFPETAKGKKEFRDLVFGEWEYRAETRKLTQANFSLDIPSKSLKILSYKNDIVLDPFSGSGTTAIACKELKRNYIGFEISKKYTKVSEDRIIKHFEEE